MTKTDLAPSAKFVHYVLHDADRPLTSAEIADRTELPDRTVRRALQDLNDRDAIEEHPSRPRDPGTPQYDTTDTEPPPRG